MLKLGREPLLTPLLAVGAASEASGGWPWDRTTRPEAAARQLAPCMASHAAEMCGSDCLGRPVIYHYSI